jgi:hypothetical protein
MNGFVGLGFKLSSKCHNFIQVSWNGQQSYSYRVFFGIILHLTIDYEDRGSNMGKILFLIE